MILDIQCDNQSTKMAEPAAAKPMVYLQKVSTAIESGMHSFFSKLGRLVALNPGRTVILALIGVIIGMSGIGVLETESRGDKLWLPSGTRSQNDWVSEYSFFLSWWCS